jgi:type IV pilus assembly protein PilE
MSSASAAWKEIAVSYKRKARGITLIELMVVIAVVAILGSIASSSYRKYLIRANRTEARMALLRVQAAQEKFFLQKHRYASEDELEDAPPVGLGVPTTTPGGMYTISFSSDSDDTQYEVIATAQGGQMRDDAACRTMSINNLGERSPGESSACWR